MSQASERLWRRRSIVLAITLTGGLVFWWSSRSSEHPAFDLLEMFPDAEKRTTLASLHEAFGLLDVTIDGDTKSSVLAHADSRIIWRIDLPARATLDTAAAIRSDAWTLESDGVIFRIGVSVGQTYDELFRRRLAPYDIDSDRHWFPVTLDLSPYAGRRIELIFNTDSGAIGNNANDAAVWGTPRIWAPS